MPVLLIFLAEYFTVLIMLLRRKKGLTPHEVARHPVRSARRTLAHQRPDGAIGAWELKDESEWTLHERVAARTLGLVSVANAVTVAGAALTASGIHDYAKGRHMKASLKMFAGRTFDLLDGKLAKRFGTTSVAGAGLDAGLDKLLATSFIAVATYKRDMSLPETGAHVAEQSMIVLENIGVKRAGGEPNPTEHGKYGQALLWLRAGGLVVRGALYDADVPVAAEAVNRASQVAAFGAVWMNGNAIVDYEQYRQELLVTPPAS
jgi:phosphatidylglycerophosphate synthase